MANLFAVTDVTAWVYLLTCADGSLYCGWTTDVERRLAAHASGRGARYTRSRLPVSLALALPMADARSARREEARIKRMSRGGKLALIGSHDAGASAHVGAAPGAALAAKKSARTSA